MSHENPFNVDEEASEILEEVTTATPALLQSGGVSRSIELELSL